MHVWVWRIAQPRCMEGGCGWHSAIATSLLCPVMHRSPTQLVAAVAPCPAHGRGGSHSCPPQPLDSCIPPPPPLQLSLYLCQPQFQWLESWQDNSASCSPPVPRAAHRGRCPRVSRVGGFLLLSGRRLGSEPWLTTPTRSGFRPCCGVCVRGSGLTCADQPGVGHLQCPATQPGLTRRWLMSSCNSRWPLGSWSARLSRRSAREWSPAV